MRITLKEVAQQAGVSYQTVSKVLNKQIKVSPATEERIFKAAEELGYKPNYTARSLRSQRSRTIGYCWPPSPFDQSNPVLDYFLQAMLHAAERKGYYILCFPYHNDTPRLLEAYSELIDTGRVDAFVLSNVEYRDPRITFLNEQAFPFAAFGQAGPGLEFPYIDVNNTTGMQAVIQHLLGQGHRKIATLAWPDDSRVGNDRLAGYFAAMAAAGIQPRPEWICRGPGTTGFGQITTRELLALPPEIRPTAIAAFNDYMALGAMNAIFEAGLRVGADIAVTGYDDSPLVQHINPPLTSVRQPTQKVGERLIEMLLTILEHKEAGTPPSQFIDPELIVRASSLRAE